MRIRFIKDAAGYKNNVAYILDDITARVLIHRGYAKQEELPSEDAPAPAPKKAPAPRTPRAAAPKKPAASGKAMKAPANRAMTAKKPAAPRRKKNEYETKDLHAKSVDE